MLLGLFVAVAIAAAEDRPARERIAVGLRVLGCCGLGIIGGSWLMRCIHG